MNTQQIKLNVRPVPPQSATFPKQIKDLRHFIEGRFLSQSKRLPPWAIGGYALLLEVAFAGVMQRAAPEAATMAQTYQAIKAKQPK